MRARGKKFTFNSSFQQFWSVFIGNYRFQKVLNYQVGEKVL